MHIVPDVLPAIDPSVDVNISYGKTTIQPGEFIDSAVSVIPPKLHAQVFDKGERLVTVVLVDSDVPNLAEDKFDYRCHFIAANVLLSPTINYIALDKLSDDKVVIPWLPPYAQKGSPYHRLSLFLLQQPEGVQLDVAAQQARTKRDNFKLRSYIDKYLLHPIGVTLFRTQWDENMAKVMRDAGLEGSGIELKRERVQPLPYKKKDGARYR
ncbi:PEBP-like protein, partial [Patellaria atrata CBS 101060]